MAPGALLCFFSVIFPALTLLCDDGGVAHKINSAHDFRLLVYAYSHTLENGILSRRIGSSIHLFGFV